MVYHSAVARKATARPLVRVSSRTYAELRELARADDRPMSELVADAVERYRRERFLAEANAAYDVLTRAAKRRYRKAFAEWDATTSDGLTDEDE